MDVMALPLMDFKRSPSWIFPAEGEASESPATFSRCSNGISSSRNAAANAFSWEVSMAISPS
ncbi:hypothetical protein D3C85_1576750 [compost metagenome]